MFRTPILVSGVKPVETKGANGIGVYVIRAVPCLLIRSDAGSSSVGAGALDSPFAERSGDRSLRVPPPRLCP